jgi:hypothetical protein
MKSRKSFLLRISPTLYQEIESWAQQDLRSVNGQIEYLLKEAVSRRGRPADDSEEQSQSPPSEQSLRSHEKRS